MNRRFHKLAGGELGDKTRAFLSGVKKFGPLFILAKAITFSIQIAAGRMLGPTEFGRANLVIFTSGLMMIPILAGLPTGLVKFASMEDDPQSQTEFISTAFLFFIPWAILWAALFYFTGDFACRLLKMPPEIYRASLPYVFFLCSYTLGASALQGLKRFRALGLVEFSYAFIFLALFAAFYFLKPLNFKVFIAANIGAYLLGLLVALAFGRDRLRFIFVWERLRALKSYMAAPMIGALAGGMLNSLLPIILAKSFSAGAVGFYSIYEAGSINIAAVASIALASVLAPMSSKSGDLEGALRRLIKASPGIVFFGFILFAASTFTVVHLVGKKYPLDLVWVALFACAAVLNLLWSLASILFTMAGVKGLWLVVYTSIISAILSLGLGFIMIPELGVSGLALSLISFPVLCLGISLLFGVIFN